MIWLVCMLNLVAVTVLVGVVASFTIASFRGRTGLFRS
jgi:hypothetical protein